MKLVLRATAVEFVADPDRLQQVLTNLLSNAIKFSPAESTITVAIESGETGVSLSVSDEGRGIPEDKLETIFDRFQQVDASDSRQKGGTGLGLAICRTIVEQHGGRIWAERNMERGATFRMFLPADPQQARPEPQPQAPRDSILVSTSDTETRTSLAASLRFHGYNVIEASSGRETLAHAQRQAPQAVLLDLKLPDMSGWEALRILKEEAATADVPVIILSAQSIGKSSTLGLGADGWLQVPAQEGELIEELRTVLERQKTWAEILLVEDDLDPRSRDQRDLRSRRHSRAAREHASGCSRALRLVHAAPHDPRRCAARRRWLQPRRSAASSPGTPRPAATGLLRSRSRRYGARPAAARSNPLHDQGTRSGAGSRRRGTCHASCAITECAYPHIVNLRLTAVYGAQRS